RMFGYSRDELVGKEIEILVPARFRNQHQQDRAGYYADQTIRPMGAGRNVYACGKSGVEFPVEVSLSPLEIRGSAFVWSAIRTIEDRERAIAQILKENREKLTALKGLVCICGWCKRVHDEEGLWQELERYIASHSATKFTHGICPDCLRKLD